MTTKEKIEQITGVPFEHLRGKIRRRQIVSCRQVLMYLMREKAGLSLNQIGDVFNRSHSSVVHSTKVVGNYKDNPRTEYKALCDNLGKIEHKDFFELIKEYSRSKYVVNKHKLV